MPAKRICMLAHPINNNAYVWIGDMSAMEDTYYHVFNHEGKVRTRCVPAAQAEPVGSRRKLGKKPAS